MRTAPTMYLVFLLTAVSHILARPDSLKERNVTFLLATSKGVSMFNTTAADSLDTVNVKTTVYTVDYHLERNLIYYFSDSGLYKHTLFPMTGHDSSEPKLVSKMSYCRSFAVDWVHNAIYWVDCDSHSLRLMDLEGKNFTTVIENLHHRHMVKIVQVDPLAGKVFWVADGTLEGSDLAGDNLHTNLSLPGVYVNTFTLDIPTSRLLYVGSSNLSTSLYEMYYGSDSTGTVKHDMSSNLEGVFSLVVLGDSVYWVKNNNSLDIINSQPLNTTGQPELIRTIDTHVWNMRIVDSELQKPYPADPCLLTNCSHFCVHQRGEARCLCPDGKILEKNTTCFGGDGRDVSFLLGTSAGVSMFNTARVDSLYTFFSDLIVSSVDYHLERNLMYFFASGTLYSSNLRPVSIKYYLEVIGRFYAGFAVNWVHNVIYWIDCSEKSLKLMDLEGKNNITLMKRPGDLTMVTRMEVDPHVGKLFWLADGVLESCDLTGEQFQTNLFEPEHVWTFSLDIPSRRLFFLLHSDLYELPYSSDGTVLSIKQTRYPFLRYVHGIVVLGDNLYFVKYSYPRYRIFRILTVMAGLPEEIKRIGKPISHMRIADSYLQKPFPEDPCRQTDCSHFCVHQRMVARCLCPDGMVVANTSCFAKDDSILFIPWECLALALLILLMFTTPPAIAYYMVHVRGKYSPQGSSDNDNL